jgi:hypothetical protein
VGGDENTFVCGNEGKTLWKKDLAMKAVAVVLVEMLMVAMVAMDEVMEVVMNTNTLVK